MISKMFAAVCITSCLAAVGCGAQSEDSTGNSADRVRVGTAIEAQGRLTCAIIDEDRPFIGRIWLRQVPDTADTFTIGFYKIISPAGYDPGGDAANNLKIKREDGEDTGTTDNLPYVKEGTPEAESGDGGWSVLPEGMDQVQIKPGAEIEFVFDLKGKDDKSCKIKLEKDKS